MTEEEYHMNKRSDILLNLPEEPSHLQSQSNDFIFNTPTTEVYKAVQFQEDFHMLD